MKKILSCLAFCTVFLGCASADFDIPAQQSQEVTTYYEAWNSTTSLPSVNTITTNLCHITYANGEGAHSQSNMLPYNVPECGGLASIDSTTLSAYPNSCVVPVANAQGSMRMKVRCQPLSDFGTVTTGSTAFDNVFGPTGSLESVSYGQQMLAHSPTFNTRNVCYLSGLGSMSVGNEYSWVNYDSTHSWVNSVGFKGLSTSARCSRLGRAGGITHALHATPGLPATGPSVSTHTCLVTKVDGSLDDGGFDLTEPGGNWRLSSWGLVSYVGADCYSRN